MYQSVFAYGTLQNPAVMQAVTGKRFESVAALISNYARYKIRKQVYPGIIPAKGSIVDGRLYPKVDKSALKFIDAFEADLYECKPVETIYDNSTITALVYVVKEKYHNLISPDHWDIMVFEKEHLGLYLEQCKKFHLACTYSMQI